MSQPCLLILTTMDRQSLVKINKLALRYFTNSLQQNKQVYRYLRGRLSEECLQKFKLGYAPRSGLLSYLNHYNVDADEAATLGLIGINEDGSQYEVFTNRIMIPIAHAGLLVGFGGRIFEDESKAKYINSKTSVLYRKSEILFGLWFSRRYVQEYNFAIVLEGYFDWLSLFDGGILNVVAVCGTAFTDMHCTILKRYASTVGIMFDGDDVGIKKSLKTLEVLQGKGMNGHILKLPKDTDPDTFLAARGTYAMRKFINSGMGIRKETLT